MKEANAIVIFLPDDTLLRKGVSSLLLVNNKRRKYETEFGQPHYDFQDIVDSSVCQLYVEDK